VTAIALAIAATLFAWWFGTGAIFWLNGLAQRARRWSIAAASGLLAVALAGIAATADQATTGAAYLGFACGLMVWAWVELTFLTGLITGPNRAPAAPGLALAARFRLAVGAILWHELTILALTALVFALSWGGATMTGAWTMLMLWAMRSSAKVNIFLGVRNTYAGLLPEHMRYLASHFSAGRVNPLFWPALAACLLAAALLFAAAAGAGPAEAAAFAILGTLAALGALEHAFLVLPVRSEALWSWGLGGRAAHLPDHRHPPSPHRPTPLPRAVAPTEAA
jgi:putative photosynthetic complex assembly protein 2